MLALCSDDFFDFNINSTVIDERRRGRKRLFAQKKNVPHIKMFIVRYVKRTLHRKALKPRETFSRQLICNDCFVSIDLMHFFARKMCLTKKSHRSGMTADQPFLLFSMRTAKVIGNNNNQKTSREICIGAKLKSTRQMDNLLDFGREFGKSFVRVFRNSMLVQSSVE